MIPHETCIAELADIHKVFRPGFRRRAIPVLRGVDLELRAGEVLALLGLNGAGKTTLMKILLGLVKPTRGRGTVLGQPLGVVAARAEIGYQPEQPYLYPALSVRETLEFMAGLSRIPARKRARRIDAVVALCALERHRDTHVRRLSRGWLQRLTLAIALLGDPRLLLLDEPLGGLDPGARMSVKEIIRSLRARGTTVLINSHELADVETLADRVALLHDGRILACGALADLLAGSDEGHELQLVSAAPVPAPGVCLAEWEPATGRSLWWIPADGPGDLQRLLGELVAGGVRIDALTPRRQGLEAFFARVTGSRPRATAAERNARATADGQAA